MAVDAVDVMSWIFQLCENKNIGKGETASKTGGNFEPKVHSPVSISAGGRIYELDTDTEVVVYEVYQTLKKYSSGAFGPKSNLTLATIFFKEHGRIVLQLNIYMSGRATARRISH